MNASHVIVPTSKGVVRQKKHITMVTQTKKKHKLKNTYEKNTYKKNIFKKNTYK